MVLWCVSVRMAKIKYYDPGVLFNYSGIICPLLQNHTILFFTDNEPLLSVINKQTSRVNEVMRMVRYMVLQCSNLNIRFKAKHIQDTKIFWLTSSLVCRSINFFKLAAHAQKEPSHVPSQLLPHSFLSALGS